MKQWQMLLVGGLGLITVADVSQAQTCAPAPPGVVGWWPGEGSAADVAGSSNGTLLGGAGFGAGRVMQGFDLDGENDAVEIPDSAPLKPTRVTVAAWVKLDRLVTPITSTFGVTGLQFVVFKKNSRTFNFEGYSLTKTRVSGVDRFGFEARNALGSGNAVHSTTVVTTGQFYHVAGTYDGTNLSLYVNGVLEGQVSGPATLDYGTRPVFIGTSGETIFDGKLDGIVDEAQIFNRALSAAEVAAIHAAGSAGLCPDRDSDTLPDPWETQFGLNPSTAVGVDGPGGDPDSDGLTNAQELSGGTHPRGFTTRYLAEGAINAFFDVRLALLNVGIQPANVLLRFLQPGGAIVTRYERLAPGRRRTLTRADLAALTSPDFSTVLESDEPVVLDRTMSWDATGYGSHAETGVASPATTWYLAEGSTSDDFALFYLIQNPNATATTATVRYLRPSGLPPIERTYPLAASSRTTIPVDTQGPELASTDVSAVITALQPIIVERAMYISRPAQVFAAGHGSAGVTAPALSWFLAEGATGPFFDLFILLANPNAQAANVTLDYLLSDGRTFTKSYVVPANGRFTVWVDDEQIPAGSGVKPLENVAVSTTVASTNGVPIIVERAMWWPGPALTSNFWTEAHNSPGATATGTRWALAEGEVGGPIGAETYVLIANTSAFAGQARVTLFFEDGGTVAKDFALGARSRTNVSASAEFPTAAGRRFATLVESLGTTPAQIVVERAMYTSPGGVTWAAGTNALATRLP